MNESSRRYAAVSGGFVATVLVVVLLLSLIVGAGEGIQYTLDSLAYGSLFAVMALGLALLFNVMGLMNFAYGELIMAGAYTMFFTRSWGWLGMILMTVLIVTILSLLMELIAFRPVRNASPVVLLVTSALCGIHDGIRSSSPGRTSSVSPTASTRRSERGLRRESSPTHG